jgi:hypothetical protein
MRIIFNCRDKILKLTCANRLYPKLGGITITSPITTSHYSWDLLEPSAYCLDTVEFFTKNMGFVPELEDYSIVGKITIPPGFTGKPVYNMIKFCGLEIPDVFFKHMTTYTKALADLQEDTSVERIVEMAAASLLSKFLATALEKVYHSLRDGDDYTCLSYHEHKAVEFTGLKLSDRYVTKDRVVKESDPDMNTLVYNTGMIEPLKQWLYVDIQVDYMDDIPTLEYVNIHDIDCDVSSTQVCDKLNVLRYYHKFLSTYNRIKSNEKNADFMIEPDEYLKGVATCRNESPT